MYEEYEEKIRLVGEWKEEPNEIINYRDEKIEFASPEDVPEKMHDILNKVNAHLDRFFEENEKLHPLLFISDFHIDYVTIHPFYDGNGRTARLLTNLLFVSCGYPPIIIKEEHEKQYHQLLADIQAYGGKRDFFYQFIGERLLDSQTIVADAIEGKELIESYDLDKEIELFKQKQRPLQNPKIIEKNIKVIDELFDKYLDSFINEYMNKHKKFEEMFQINNMHLSID